MVAGSLRGGPDGGVYVPTLSQKIYEAGSAFGGTMRGYLVGNGVFDHTEALPTHAAFAAGHGFLSSSFTARITAACGNYSTVSDECQKLTAMISSFEVDVNGYDAYRTCYQPGGRRASPTLGGLLERILRDGEQPRYPRSASNVRAQAIVLLCADLLV
jgi:hypothetical protein